MSCLCCHVCLALSVILQCCFAFVAADPDVFVSTNNQLHGMMMTDESRIYCFNIVDTYFIEFCYNWQMFLCFEKL